MDVDAAGHALVVLNTRPREHAPRESTGNRACSNQPTQTRSIDHHVAEVVGWHTAKLGDRWAALEPIRQGVRHAFGRFGKEVARGLALRCDWGPQYTADAWINEVKWLGCTISPSYVGEPECNGVAERFMRTLKAQCIYVHQFASLEQARQLIGEFIARYNAEWLIERLGHRTPAQARADALARVACR